MVIYLIAFAITLPFIIMAKNNYCKALKTSSYLCVGNNGNTLSSSKIHKRGSVYRLKYSLFFLLAFFPLFFLSAVRYGIGTDYFHTYVPEWFNILDGERPYAEWGFNALNIILQIFTNNPQWLFIITSFLFVYLLLRTLIRCSDNVVLSVLLVLLTGIYFWSLNNVRQALAAVILFAGYPHLVRGNAIRYMAIVVLAALFHMSALIMALVFILANLKVVRRNFIAVCLIMLVLLPIVCKLIEKGLMNTKYSYYFDSSYENGKPSNAGLIYDSFFLIIAFLIFYRQRLKSKQAFVLLLMQFISFWISCASLFIRIPEMISRFSMFFLLYKTLTLPYMCKLIKRHDNKLAVETVYIVAYVIFFVFYFCFKGVHEVIPYQWIF